MCAAHGWLVHPQSSIEHTEAHQKIESVAKWPMGSKRVKRGREEQNTHTRHAVKTYARVHTHTLLLLLLHTTTKLVGEYAGGGVRLSEQACAVVVCKTATSLLLCVAYSWSCCVLRYTNCCSTSSIKVSRQEQQHHDA